MSDREIMNSKYGNKMKELLYFTSQWCGPCKRFRPLMEDLSTQIPIQFIDVDSNKSLAQQYGVRNIPTTILVRGGKEISRFEGTKPISIILENYHNG